MTVTIQLSRREREVAGLVTEGLTNREIAERLFISERTAEGHVEQIRNKLGFGNRSQIAAWFAAGAGQAVDASRGSAVPVPRTSLVGRADEIAQAMTLVQSTQLVTLVGPGGVGKTRIAQEAALRLEQAFGDGMWWVDLSAVSAGDSVPSAVANAVNLTQATHESAQQQLIRFMRTRKALLVLDNCEHVVEACATLVESLLGTSMKVRILATSREELGVHGERVIRVSPLPVSAAGDEHSEAVELFFQRCSDLGVNKFTPMDATPASAICERLDGMPLAIELAAVQTEILSIADIEAQLSDRFRLLKGATRTTTPRHQTLEAAVDWSFQQLNPIEQRAFARLGVFPAGFDRQATAAVLEADDAATVAMVGRLIRKSLVNVGQDISGQTRYAMLETLRQFARNCLAESGELEEARTRHAEYYAALAHAECPKLRGPEAERYLRRLDEETSNFAAALNFLETKPDDRFPSLVASLKLLWSAGRIRDSYGWAERALEHPGTSRATRKTLLELKLLVAMHHDDWDLSFQAARDLLEEATRCDDETLIARALSRMASLQTDHDGQFAHDLWKEAEEHARRCGDDWMTAAVLNDLGMTQIELHNPESGLPYVLEAIALSRRIGDDYALVQFLDSVAWAEVEMGRLGDARTLFAEGIGVVLGLSSRWALPVYLEGFARIAHAEGAADTSCRLIGAAEGVRDRLGSRATDGWVRYLASEKDKLRREMGDKHFEVCWSDGFRMTEDAAAALALSLIDQRSRDDPHTFG